jgi:5-carboxymethyl-2-hydroxymuconate isomerase
MAHAIVEWTDNLTADGFVVGPLLELIAAAMRDAGGVFPIGGIRVRGVRVEDYVIADGKGDDAFINITVRMAAGRPEAFKRSFFEGLFDAIKVHLAPQIAARPLALSMYIDESDEASSFKYNTIHLRLNKGH